MLDPVGHYNDLSPELRASLEKKIESFGTQVTYLFDIAKDDPHPENRGMKVYPQIFTLTPGTFSIQDKQEKRPGKSALKTIGVIKGLPDEKGRPVGFEKMKVFNAQMGRFTLDLTTREGQDLAMMAELHPKHSGGMFQNTNLPAVFRRLDEKANAKKNSEIRALRTEALIASQEMTDDEILEFAAGIPGMDEYGDSGVVRDQVEAFAENDPAEFMKIVNSGTVAHKAIVKRAFDKQILIFIPIENKVIWHTNQQLLAVLPFQEADSTKTHIDLMADWLIASKDGEKTYKTLRSLLGLK